MEKDKNLMGESLSDDNISSIKETAEFIVSVLDSKKASDIKLLHVEKQTVIADYFVICTGNSRTQIRALADEVDHQLEGYGITALRTEGMDSGIWVLKDYGAVILHIFNSQSRDFYKLEKLYDGTIDVDISEIIAD